MLECGPCADSTPHRYAGDMWCCLRCEATAQAAEIERLKAEVSRLTPKSPTSLESSGQVAEDVALVRREMPDTAIVTHGHRALSRLAAKAQGYEAAVADNAALLQALLDVAELRLSGPTLAALAERLRAEPHPGAALLKEREEREERLEVLAAALDQHGRHDSGCLTKKSGGFCLCGLTDALHVAGKTA